MKMNPDGTFEIDRDDNSFPCPKCGGYSDSVECTSEEREEYGCGRSWDCCSVAFICSKCGHRFAMRRPSPESEW